MKIVNRVALSVFILWAVTYLYGQDVHYNYARGANFQSYKTYQWVNAVRVDQLIDADIKRAIDEQLAQKGLTKVEKGGDILVTYYPVLREEKAVNLNAFGWRNYGWANGSVNGQTSTIPMGTLVVDLYDPAQKQLIWRGDASKSLEGMNKDPNKNYKQVQKAMAKLFKNYPPPAK